MTLFVVEPAPIWTALTLNVQTTLAPTVKASARACGRLDAHAPPGPCRPASVAGSPKSTKSTSTGSSSLSVKAGAFEGPLFVTVTVHSNWVSRTALDGPDLATSRSAWVLTVVTTVLDVSLPALESLDAETVAVLLSDPVTPASTVAVIFTCTVCPLVRFERASGELKFMPGVQPPVGCVQNLAFERPAGKVSDTETPVAVEDPMFVIVRSYVMDCPPMTEAGPRLRDAQVGGRSDDLVGHDVIDRARGGVQVAGRVAGAGGRH